MEFTTNTEIEDRERAAIGAQGRRPVVSSLAGYVRNAFDEAERHRQDNGVTERILRSRRMKSGIYEANKAQAIAERGGSSLFFNITETKCEAFVAWAESVFAPAGDRPWDCQPTPIPNLPDGVAQNVFDLTVTRFSEVPGATPEEVRQFALDLYDQTINLSFEQAKEACERMVRKMEDQTAEGGFADAFAQFLEDMGTYPTAVLKGPVFVRKQRLAHENGSIGVKNEVIPTWECVDPFRFYPGPNARHANEAYVCEVVDYDARSLSEMRGVENWNTAAIERVLSFSCTALSAGVSGNPGAFLTGESEKAVMENRVMSQNEGLPDSTLRAIEFWGSVPGTMLQSWGMQGIEDPHKYYEVNCVLIGAEVVRAVLNPDPLGRRPYYTCSFLMNKNSVWGLKSIPEKMADCQEGVNGAMRNLLNNLGMASGPMVAVDIDAIPPEHVPTVTRIWPWKVWPFRGGKTQQREPVRFFQPNTNAAELLQVAEYFENKGDDRTLIPRYVYGDNDLSGAGATASGLSMMMNASNRGIQRVFKNIDRYVMKPAIERLYTWNMVYLNDASLKGDLQIVPRGILALLVREQVQLRRQEFLSATNNPTDLQIIGIEGRATLLREIASGLDIPVDKIVPSEDELRRRAETQLAAQTPNDTESDRE